MSRPFLAALIALAFVLSASSAARADTVWSALVMANNTAQPSTTPPELGKLEGTLKQLFGYNQFQIIGQVRKTLTSGEEDWVASSKYFMLHIDSKVDSGASSYLVNLKLFQEKKLLLETDARLSKRSPLVIKGPQVGAGQLVLVLVVE